MARTDNEDYDWINDPFDETKNAEDQFKMSARSKRLIVLALVLVIVVVAVLVALSLGALSTLFLL